MPIDLKNVPRWAWVVAALVAIGVFLYLRHRGSSAPAGTTTADPTDTAALGGTPDPGIGGGAGMSAGGSDYGQLLNDLSEQQAQFYADYLANQNGLDGAGITPADWQDLTTQLLAQISSRNTIGTASGNPVYRSPSGAMFTVGVSGATQPAYVGPGGGLVSPTTYAGLGVTPQPITPGMVQPPLPMPVTTIQMPAGAAGMRQTVIKPPPNKYYTYKKQVPIHGNQTLHYTPGKGYYAA